MENDKYSRRCFLRTAMLSAGTIALASVSADAENDVSKQWLSKKKSAFSMWQIPSHQNTIGNSYVFRTEKGKIIVMDGGFPQEELFMRGFLASLGNEVEAWFISHPHDDHMGALNEILKNPRDLKVKTVYHSRVIESVIQAEKDCEPACRDWYNTLDHCTTSKIVDIQEPGQVFQFDGMYLKILSVANEFTQNAYNNSSMIMRVWDKRKSVLFLGDAGVECGKKVLASSYRSDLDCEYLQMAHHGQNGCDEDFYRSIRFRACLWPTPLWVWNNDQGKGYDTGILNTIKTRGWMDKLQIKEHHVSCLEGLYKID